MSEIENKNYDLMEFKLTKTVNYFDEKPLKYKENDNIPSRDMILRDILQTGITYCNKSDNFKTLEKMGSLFPLIKNDKNILMYSKDDKEFIEDFTIKSNNLLPIPKLFVLYELKTLEYINNKEEFGKGYKSLSLNDPILDFSDSPIIFTDIRNNVRTMTFKDLIQTCLSNPKKHDDIDSLSNISYMFVRLLDKENELILSPKILDLLKDFVTNCQSVSGLAKTQLFKKVELL